MGKRNSSSHWCSFFWEGYLLRASAILLSHVISQECFACFELLTVNDQWFTVLSSCPTPISRHAGKTFPTLCSHSFLTLKQVDGVTLPLWKKKQMERCDSCARVQTANLQKFCQETKLCGMRHHWMLLSKRLPSQIRNDGGRIEAVASA